MSVPAVIMISIFVVTVLCILWRPFGINESIPTTIAAGTILLMGLVPLADVFTIFETVTGASITILSTIVMSIVLESVGFFRWAAINLAIKSKGSGILLFWYINLLCFLMTLFFNNDGSILITTPIIIQTLSFLRLKPHQQIPFLISGALVATAASAPIGVSNLANLIALKIVGLDLNAYASMMFVPSMAGIVCIAAGLFLYFRKDIPADFGNILERGDAKSLAFQMSTKRMPHPLGTKAMGQAAIDWKMFRLCIGVVVLTRISFFALAPFGISTEWPAVIGAVLLIVIRWHQKKIGPMDILKKSPWHILLFAFSMYVIIFGLHNIGMTSVIVNTLGDTAAQDPLYAIFIMGLLLTILSNICNNLPSVMIGTISIKEMGLGLQTMQVAYLANVIGADIGSLILPMGTLASLLWLHTLRQYKIPMNWGKYLRVTLSVIPVSLILSLQMLYLWTKYVVF
ncbi:arsenic transporter [Brevibacillus sp. GCM10020057]|uniref:arsenic transporter n=1 Tax=Brevibacillus sp. GCM10020057 TaxID=3317327 RepID=UPI0036261B5E